ncbi:HD domain-containing protein [Clostridium felsineum]|uniref:HD domain-containing protein n=1 Tax=Clostridium felsineum TaxID=36839 RepID=UPI00214DE987|nr:HD domain-containing protein [Clostridium felsineum]MCR3761009.1 HD domain-containing protein [Clostridium felsineum]
MNDIIRLIKDIITEVDIKAYVVGGYVRDKLINSKNEPEDLDIVFEDDFEGILDILKDKGAKISLIKKDLNVYRASYKGCLVDISRIKGKNIEEDLNKRDFTINAIALDVKDNKIIDPFKGRLHIKRRIIQVVNENSLKEDAVRILRGVRFYIKYGMHFNGYTEEYIREEAKNIMKFPKDRVLDEIMHSIHNDESGVFFEVMDQYMVLKNILPYTEELKTVGKCKYHLVDAFTHMNTAYRVFKDLKKGYLKVDNLNLERFEKKIGLYDESDYLAFAVFVHDIGKYVSYKKEGECISFKGHDEKGLEIIEKVCDELKFPIEGKKIVSSVVRNHMYPLMIFKTEKEARKLKEYEFFKNFDKYIPHIIVASFCDVYATKIYIDHGNEKASFIEFISELMLKYNKFKNLKINRLLDGNNLIDLGLNGNDIGDMINKLDKFIYLEGSKTREEQQKFVLKMIK